MTKINNSPVFTSQNFGINFLEIDEKQYTIPPKPFLNVFISPKSKKLENLTKQPKIESMFHKNTNNQPNFCKKLVLKNNEKVKIEFNIDQNNRKFKNLLTNIKYLIIDIWKF